MWKGKCREKNVHAFLYSYQIGNMSHALACYLMQYCNYKLDLDCLTRFCVKTAYLPNLWEIKVIPDSLSTKKKYILPLHFIVFIYPFGCGIRRSCSHIIVSFPGSHWNFTSDQNIEKFLFSHTWKKNINWVGIVKRINPQLGLYIV